MNISIFESEKCAQEIAEALRLAHKEFGNSMLAIPGGRSPGVVLEVLAKIIEPDVNQNLALLWVDERAVAVGHEDRNDLATLSAWEKGGVLPGKVCSMPAEQGDLAEASQQYKSTFDQVSGGRPIDVSLLGIGEDGHFASLFPNHAGLNNQEDVFYLEDSPKPPPRRLSLSLPCISDSNKIMVLAFGEAKGQVIKKVKDEGATKELPVSLLPQEKCEYLLDEAAMQVLKN